MHYFFFTPSFLRLLQRTCALGLCCSALLSAHAASNDVDEEGRLIAAPDETDLVERGYLFYPQRVLPKNPKDKRRQATAATANAQPVVVKADPVSAADQIAAAQPVHDEHGATSATTGKPGDAQDSHAVTSQTLPPVAVKSTDPHAKASDKPVAGSVIVQPLERVKAVKLPDHAATTHASDKSGHAGDEDTQPVLSKAEQAKLDRAKAAEARAEKMKEEQAKAELARAERLKQAQIRAELAKEEQAKAELARAERLKEAQAKAELARAERAKAAQARAEKLKEDQAKAELARAERAKATAQAKALKAQEELVKAEKLFEELSKADKAKAEAPKEEQAKEETGKDEHAKPESAKAEPAKADAAKTEPAKDAHAKDEHAKPDSAKAEPAKAEPVKAEATKPEPAKDAHAKDEHSKDAHAKDEHAKPESAKADAAKDPHAAPSPATAAAGQKLLLTTPESRLLTAAE